MIRQMVPICPHYTSFIVTILSYCVTPSKGALTSVPSSNTTIQSVETPHECSLPCEFPRIPCLWRSCGSEEHWSYPFVEHRSFPLLSVYFTWLGWGSSCDVVTEVVLFPLSSPSYPQVPPRLVLDHSPVTLVSLPTARLLSIPLLFMLCHF